MNRDFNDPEYMKWRKQVFKRDAYKCQMPDCKGKKLEAHHIVRWADNIMLRYDVANGITLCKYHHKIVTGHEPEFASMFKHLVWAKSVPFDIFIELERKLHENN